MSMLSLQHVYISTITLSISDEMDVFIILWTILSLFTVHCLYLTVAVTLSFDGTQYFTITLDDNDNTTVGEDISLRFQTDRENGLLLSTSSSDTEDRLMVALDGGEVRVDVDIGGVKKTIRSGEGLGDNEWHTIKVRRRFKRLKLTVDDGEPARGKITMKDPDLQVDEINIGSENSSFNARLNGAQTVNVKVDNIELGKKTTTTTQTSPSSPENFVGHMQQLIYNRKHFFDMAFRTGQLSQSYINTNAKVNHEEKLVEFPFTIRSPASYLMVRQKIQTTFEIYFRFKTTQPHGLILYSGNGNGNDFMALEIYNGVVRYVFDVGNSPRVLESNLSRPVSDNEWHSVSLLRVQLRQHILRVDGSASYDVMEKKGNVHLDIGEEIYIGGAKPDVFSYLPKEVKSTNGYLGCLGSLDLDTGETQNILQSGVVIPEQFTEQVKEGCQGPQEVCTPGSCQHMGVCVQKWNDIKCDCDMTSFTGPTCNEASTAYKFEGKGGVIAFHVPLADRKDTKVDKLALAFKTTQRDAVLTRINSANSHDYIEMELVDGNIFVVYNMGTMDHPIGELFERVNDGKYHVVRFTRSGPNSTIQVDNMDKQTKNPTGHQLNIFNNQSDVYIGGKIDIRGRTMRPFIGTIAGYVLNGQRILDYAADSDPRIHIDQQSDVQLDLDFTPDTEDTLSTTTLSSSNTVISTPSTPNLSTPLMLSTSGTKKSDTDDIVISSGLESGCGTEETGCTAHTTDSLITPNIKLTPTSTTTSTTEKPSSIKPTPNGGMESESSGNGCEDDDEECVTDGGETANKIVMVTTDDIEFVSTEEETTATNSILISADITEHTTKQTATHSSSTQRLTTTTKSSKTRIGGKSPGIDNSKKSVNEHFGFNIALIIGIAASVVLLLLILGYALYKYRSRDEGTYKVDESKNYRYETVSTKPPNQPQQQQNGSSLTKPITNGPKAKKKGSVKEWYV